MENTDYNADSYQNVIVIDEKLAKRWSRVGQRAAFGLAMMELAKNDDKLIALTADVSTSAGLERIKRNYPDQFIDVGIAEQNMMSIAAGLASEGFDVVTATFAPFQSMRCLEQIRVNLGYMKNKVVMVGLASGVGLGTLGNTHCCFEDMGVLRAIPNIAIVSPADCGEVGKALEAAVRYHQSVYIRLTGLANQPIVYHEDYPFEIGKSIRLKEGTDITIFAIGTMVHTALETAKILEEKNISTEVVNMHTVKPIDVEAVKKACTKSKMIVTLEEHNIFGGLGTAVAECKTSIFNAPYHMMIGLPDEYQKGAHYEKMIEKNELTPEKVAERICEGFGSIRL